MRIRIILFHSIAVFRTWPNISLLTRLLTVFKRSTKKRCLVTLKFLRHNHALQTWINARIVWLALEWDQIPSTRHLLCFDLEFTSTTKWAEDVERVEGRWGVEFHPIAAGLVDLVGTAAGLLVKNFCRHSMFFFNVFLMKC